MNRWLQGLVLGGCLLGMALMMGGCGRAVGGPTFWWDDRARQKLPDDYALPPAPEQEIVINEERGENPIAAPNQEIDEDTIPSRMTTDKPISPPTAIPGAESGARSTPGS